MLARLEARSAGQSRLAGLDPVHVSVYVALVGLLAASAALSDRFLTVSNILNVLSRAAPLGIVSLGQTLVVLTAGIDMSVGVTLSLVTVITAGLLEGHPTMAPAVVLLVMAMGLAIGLANGLIVCRLKVPAFVGTLAMSSILHGFLFMYAKQPVGQVTAGIARLAWGRWGPLPLPIVLLAVLVVLLYLLLRFTTLGRSIYATGANAQVAYLSGINTVGARLFAYAACGLLAVIAGLIVAGRMGVGDPLVGESYTLDSIAAVLIGGTSLFGGRGGVLGTATGVLIMIFLNNIFNLTNTPAYWQWIIKGVIIIATVGVYWKKK